MRSNGFVFEEDDAKKYIKKQLSALKFSRHSVKDSTELNLWPTNIEHFRCYDHQEYQTKKMSPWCTPSKLPLLSKHTTPNLTLVSERT